MSKSLLEQLPSIVAAGKRQASQILEQVESPNRVTLQTRELVIPSKDSAAYDLFHASRSTDAGDSPNRLIYGDNLLAMAALLAGDEDNPSLRGKVDLIYIDRPFDSKADYRTKITLPGTTIEQKPTVIEQFAYSDTWADGTASYLDDHSTSRVDARAASGERDNLCAFRLEGRPFCETRVGRDIRSGELLERDYLVLQYKNNDIRLVRAET